MQTNYLQRQNFTGGTLRTFSVKLDTQLGAVTRLKLWHDNSGKYPHWFIDKVVVDDHRNSER